MGFTLNRNTSQNFKIMPRTQQFLRDLKSTCENVVFKHNVTNFGLPKTKF